MVYSILYSFYGSFIKINSASNISLFYLILSYMPTELKDDVLHALVDLLQEKDFKKKLVKELNDNVDVPIINEKTEKKVMDKIYDTVVKAIKNINN